MTSFSQWWTGFLKKQEVRQVTWVCGTEPVLIDEVARTIRWALNPEPGSYVSLVAGADSERDIWAEVFQQPLGKSSRRLVVIRNAERLKEPDRIIEFVRGRIYNPRTFLLFLSNDPTVPRVPLTEEERREHIKPAAVPYIAVLEGTKGHVVECRPFTNATAKHAVTWVQSKVKMREGVAGHLLNRSNGDLRLARDLCVKLSVYPGEVSMSVINDLLEQKPRDTFVNALLALDRKTAVHALRSVPTSDYGRILGLLDAQLDFAGTVHDMLIAHRTESEIAREVREKRFLLPDVLPVAKHYSAKRREQVRRVLATADSVLRAGETRGILEVVCLLW